LIQVADLPRVDDIATRSLARALALDAPDQPPLLDLPPAEVNAALGTLALGGAERIVLDWAVRTAVRHRVRLVVLREAHDEWPAPPGVEVIRLHGVALEAQLAALGAVMVAGGNPVVVCHLLTAAERDALARGGACPVPVLHNAEPGWIEPAAALAGATRIIAVSEAAAAEALAATAEAGAATARVRAAGGPMTCSVIRHLPAARLAAPEARAYWRERWALPRDALVIGMLGGVKPQKAYPRALRILAALLARHPAYLVIVGGPVGRDGALAWQALLAQARRLGVEPYVRLPGFVRDAARSLPAFDVVLNTSRSRWRHSRRWPRASRWWRAASAVRERSRPPG
jgi:glycosyltransferase involved in cell wall biosynthesis